MLVKFLMTFVVFCGVIVVTRNISKMISIISCYAVKQYKLIRSFVAWYKTCSTTWHAQQLSRQTCSYYSWKFDLGMFLSDISVL